MILNILIHKNTKIKCFTQPVFIDIDPEKVAIQESRTILTCNEGEKILPYKNLKLYFVGLFNDETGDIITVDEEGQPLMRELLDCKKIVKSRLNELGWTEKDHQGVKDDA